MLSESELETDKFTVLKTVLPPNDQLLLPAAQLSETQLVEVKSDFTELKVVSIQNAAAPLAEDIDNCFEDLDNPEDDPDCMQDDSDCTRNDPDYTQDDTDYTQDVHIAESEIVDTSKKVCKPYSLKKVQTRKRNRNLGLEYETAKGKIKKSRTMKPLRADCRNQCNKILSDEHRKNIFQEYWSLGSYDKRIAYIASLINVHETKLTRKKIEGKATRNRSHSYIYNLEINAARHVVCKTCFLNTLGETEKFITVAVSKKLSSHSGITNTDQRGKHTPVHKTPQHKIDEVNEHISSFPAYESHYSRRHTDKKYLAVSLNLSLMYKLYYEKYPTKPVAIKMLGNFIRLG